MLLYIFALGFTNNLAHTVLDQEIPTPKPLAIHKLINLLCELASLWNYAEKLIKN